MIKLNQIPWKQKIKELCLININGKIVVELFFNFVKNSMDPNGEIFAKFSDHKEFEKAYNLMVEKSFESMPKFKSYEKNCYRRPNRRTRMYERQSKITFTLQNIRQQSFTVPFSLLNYIRENVNAKIMAKFYRTCKYFYQKNPFCILENLSFEDDLKDYIFIEFSINNHTFLIEVNLLSMLNNIWITNRIILNCYEPKEFLRKIVRCDAEHVRIHPKYNHPPYPPLPLNAYQFLTKSIKSFDFTSQEIAGADGKLVSVQELLEFLPNAKSIRADVQGFSRQPSRLTTAFPPRKTKIEHLHLAFYNEPNIDAHSFWKIIENALAPKAHIELRFCYLTDKAFLPEFKREMRNKIETWRPRNEKPSFTTDA